MYPWGESVYVVNLGTTLFARGVWLCVWNSAGTSMGEYAWMAEYSYWQTINLVA